MITVVAGNDTDREHAAVGTLVRVTISHANKDTVVFLEPIRAVKITGYGQTSKGVRTAKVSYPNHVASNSDRLHNLGAMVQILLGSLPPMIRKSNGLVNQAIAEKDVRRLANLLAQEMPFSQSIKQKLLALPSHEALMDAVTRR